MFKKRKSYLIPLIGFALIILIGSILLMLPVTNNKDIAYKDALFTSVSALTCTGLSTIVPSEQFNFFGQLVIAILMEIGAMGFIIFIAYYWIKRKKKINLSDTLMINESIQSETLGEVRSYELFVMKTMIGVQTLGVILLSIKFVPQFGLLEGIWKSIFHTIASFANAGFDIFGKNSMSNYSNDSYVQIVLIILMVLGSVGIFVINDLKKNSLIKLSKLRLQSKITLSYTLVLLIVPVLIFKIFDPELSILNSLFISASSRSTGFMIGSISNLSIITKYIIMILMFIGGSPASTAGGVRIIGIAVIVSTIVSIYKGKDSTIMFWKKVPDEIVKKSFVIFMTFLIILVVGLMVINYFDQDYKSFDLLFESTSALTNTGLSVVNYETISMQSQIAIMILMFIGRVGPLSLILAFVGNENKKQLVEFPTENIII